MNRYIKRKLNDYLYELSTSEFRINKWRKLELITAFKNKSLLYEDVPEYIKEKYDLPTRDEGIDVVKLNNETIIETYQCKDYNGYVSNHSLGTYFAFHLYKLIGIPFNIVGSNNSVFNSMVTPIIYDTNEIFNHGLIIDNENNILKKLRWYQKEAIELIEKVFFENINEISTNNEVRIKIPCGCGKTALIYYFGMSNLNILVMVPKINIGEQIQDYFETTLNKKCNCYWTDNIIECKSNVTICVYNSVEHVVNNNYDIIFIDEAHHIVGSKLYKYYDNKEYYSEDSDEDIDKDSSDDSYENLEQTSKSKNEPISDYKSFISKIQNLNSTIKVYLSATIDNPTYELPFDKAIEEEYLSDYEFNILYVDPTFDSNYNQLVEIINENKEYKHIILYCNRIETANYINNMLKSNGIISEVITSEQTKMKRNRILNDFRNELIKVICSVNCLNEGTDLPIADTCMFVNDRGSEINIIQCIGRILRKHQFKNKSRIVLFDSNPDDAELKYEYYLRVLDKIDIGFKTNVKRKLKLYNYVHDVKFDITKKQYLYFDKIIHFRLSLEDKLKLCMEFYNEHHRMPKGKERYNGFGIGYFITDNRKLNNQDKINQLKQIFKEHWIDGNINEYRFQQKCELCKQFYNVFKRLPTINEKYKNINIGWFIDGVKTGNDQHKINQLKSIFKEQWFDGSISIFQFQEKLKLCQEFYVKFKRLPKDKEIYKDFNICVFIKNIRAKNDQNKINQLKQIFKEHWIDGDVNEYRFQEKLELCKQFYNEFKILPKDKEIYKDFNIGRFISGIRKGNDQHKIDKLKEIFKEHWDYNTFNDYKFQQKIKLCQEFYTEFKRLPKDKEIYNGFGIGCFIYGIRTRNDQNKINQLKDIFKEHWIDGNINEYRFQQKCELCKQFYNEFKRLPKNKEIYKSFGIDSFIKGIRTRNDQDKINQLEEIFHCKFN